MPTHYFLGNRLLATCRDFPKWDDLTLSFSNQIFVCPRCGDIWGRIMQDGAEDFYPVRRGCSRHRYTDTVGGSFIAPWRKTFAELPPEVLAYELNLRLDQFEKENGI